MRVFKEVSNGVNANYTYLISSLPMLHFGIKPPFPFEKFLEICARLIPPKDWELLKNVSLNGEYDYELKQPTLLNCWYEFDTALRNELAKLRAVRKRVDPVKYLRRDGYYQLSIVHLAMNAQRSPSLIEAEKMLDQGRWQMLEDLNFGHYFDIDSLIIYALKLLLLGRWERINCADKAGLLEEALA